MLGSIYRPEHSWRHRKHVHARPVSAGARLGVASARGTNDTADTEHEGVDKSLQRRRDLLRGRGLDWPALISAETGFSASPHFGLNPNFVRMLSPVMKTKEEHAGVGLRSAQAGRDGTGMFTQQDGRYGYPTGYVRLAVRTLIGIPLSFLSLPFVFLAPFPYVPRAHSPKFPTTDVPCSPDVCPSVSLLHTFSQHT
jgi:hypothetical protein